MTTKTARGVAIPAMGFGTWNLRGQACREGVRDALALGYRHLDTAAMYHNEDEVGAGLADAGVDRDEVFIVTKIPPSSLDRRGVRDTVAASLEALGTHVDLLLIHWPNEHVPLGETLEAMRAEQDAGHARHLGVSNFSPALLDEALEHADVVCDQVEYHPFRSQTELVRHADERDVVVTAYSPLAKGRVLRDGTLQAIAEAHDVTPAEVALAWLIAQPRVVAIPKAASHDHRTANLRALDVQLSDDEQARIDALSR